MPARSQLAKWGNSLAVRIQKNMAEAAALSEGDFLDIQVMAKGSIAMKASVQPSTLDELVAQITPENVHTPVDWGTPTGNEHWQGTGFQRRATLSGSI